MKKKVLIPIPLKDFDPSETGIPWSVLTQAGAVVTFATPTGEMGQADIRMINGSGLGPLAAVLAADQNGLEAYQKMVASSEFNTPVRWDEINFSEFDGIIIPGGHAKGMRQYLESEILQNCVAKFFSANKAVGAICHGVVLAARSKKTESPQSVLFGKKTTALLASQELFAWLSTGLWLGDYYRTYPQTVEAEVKSALSSSNDFIKGPLPLFRDNPKDLKNGFVVRDGNYLSARWPGDAHCFGYKFLDLLNEQP